MAQLSTRSAGRPGVAVVLVEQKVDEALRFAQDAVVLDHGEVVARRQQRGLARAAGTAGTIPGRGRRGPRLSPTLASTGWRSDMNTNANALKPAHPIAPATAPSNAAAGVPVATSRPGCVVDVDPFSDAFLTDPYPDHERMREAGPIIWIPKYGIYASARHAEVRTILNDHATFISSAGVGPGQLQQGDAVPAPEPDPGSRPAGSHPGPCRAGPHPLAQDRHADPRDVRGRSRRTARSDDGQGGARRPRSTGSGTWPRSIRSRSSRMRSGSSRKAARCCCSTAT